jgi:hypothetical protein
MPRTYYGWQAFYISPDETWASYPLWLAASVEVQVSVVSHSFIVDSCSAYNTLQICACVPTTRALFAKVFPSLGTRLRSTSNRTAGVTASTASKVLARGSVLSWKSPKTNETITEDPESQSSSSEIDPNMSWPLTESMSTRKATNILGEDGIQMTHNQRGPPLYIMTERSVEVTRSGAQATGQRPEYMDIDHSNHQY